MNVSEIMSTYPAAIEAGCSAEEARERAWLLGVHQLLVVDRGELIGAVCCCDLAPARAGETVLSRTKTAAVPIGADEPMERAARIAQISGIGCLPVIDKDGKLVGIVTRRDLRAQGLLEPGLDCCSCCGRRQDLSAATCPDAVVICGTCVERDILNQRRTEPPETPVAESA
jgi:CBS domain-containing protein